MQLTPPGIIRRNIYEETLMPIELMAAILS
jgi:hypothetical protein